MRGTELTFAALAVVAAMCSASAAEETVQVNSFPSGSNLPVWVGQREGTFARHGIAVALSHPKGSVEQLKGLIAGNYQILLTALDNVAAYHDGQGAAEIGGPVDLVAIMGMDTGFLTLVAAPEVKTIAGLAGKTLAVDALSTGFSFALQELLARGGVAKDAVSYVAVGSSGERWKALQAGKAQGALLAMPLDLEAVDKGYVKLATVAGTLGHYQATVAAVQESWAAAHRATLVAFLRGYGEAVTWLVAPEHKDAAIATLHAEMPNLDPSQLSRIVALLTDPREGVGRDLAIDPAGAEMVLALRARYAVPARPAQDWHRYVDLSFLDEARK